MGQTEFRREVSLRGARGRLTLMSRESAVLAALSGEPASTSAIYDRVGYPALTRVGLVSYPAFRAELAKLSAAGLAESHTGDDGSTLWRLPENARGAGGGGTRGAGGADEPPEG
jgi:hypothetical protein